MSEGLRAQRLVALFVAGWLLFNFPLLALWDGEVTFAGVPLFPAALFLLWALLIAAIAWVGERGDVAPGAPNGADATDAAERT